MRPQLCRGRPAPEGRTSRQGAADRRLWRPLWRDDRRPDRRRGRDHWRSCGIAAHRSTASPTGRPRPIRRRDSVSSFSPGFTASSSRARSEVIKPDPRIYRAAARALRDRPAAARSISTMSRRTRRRRAPFGMHGDPLHDTRPRYGRSSSRSGSSRLASRDPPMTTAAASLEVCEASVSYGAHPRARPGVARAPRAASSSRSWAPRAAARPRCCAPSAGSSRGRRLDRGRRARHHPAAARQAQHRDGVPVLRPVAAHDGGAEHRLWPETARRRPGARSPGASPRCSRCCASRGSASAR